MKEKLCSFKTYQTLSYVVNRYISAIKNIYKNVLPHSFSLEKILNLSDTIGHAIFSK